MPRRAPDDDDVLALKFDGLNDREIPRLDLVAVADEVLHDAVHLVFLYPLRRELREALVLLDPDNDVPTASVVDVVGEGADAVEDGLRVEPLLVVKPRRFDEPLQNQILYVYRQFHSRSPPRKL